MVRVAGLVEQETSRLGVRSADGMTPHQALAAIRKRVVGLTQRQARLWKKELRPALEAEGIAIVSIEDCSQRELERLRALLRARDLPSADPARGRARAAVSVHLGALPVARRARGRPRDG